jgi:hypothetical protein
MTLFLFILNAGLLIVGGLDGVVVKIWLSGRRVSSQPSAGDIWASIRQIC